MTATPRPPARTMPFARLPISYDECRARFRHACAMAGLAWRSHPIDARGPDGQSLTVEETFIGPDNAAGVLVVLSGVHGVEGFIGSAPFVKAMRFRPRWHRALQYRCSPTRVPPKRIEDPQ